MANVIGGAVADLSSGNPKQARHLPVFNGNG